MPGWKDLLKKGQDLAKQAKAEVDARGGLAEVAKQAKTELENRGLIGEQASQEHAPTAPRDAMSDADQVRQVVGPDHPHPYHLLTSAEVASALRVEPHQLTGPTPNIADNAAGASWRVDAGAEAITIDLLLYTDPADVEELVGYGEEPARRLPHVGDRAAITREAVAVQRGGETVGIWVYGGDVDWQPALESLARSVADRLPDFAQYAARMAAPGGPVLTDVLPTSVAAEIVGVPLDTPRLERTDEEVRVTWHGPQPADQETDEVRVEVRQYLVDPWDKQRQMAQSGNAFEKAFAQIGEALTERLKDAYAPATGPWDLAYLGPTEGYIKKGTRSFAVEISGIPRDTSAEVRAIAERLAGAV
jgi:hypothetical protein